MEEIITKEYISFDGKIFKEKEFCKLYEKNYLTDDELEECFHFFHKKHENFGDIDNAIFPSDARHYKFKIERYFNDRESLIIQTIKLYSYYKSKSIKQPFMSELYSKYTLLGLIIKSDMDFSVLYEQIVVPNELVKQGEKTYNIKEFHKFIYDLKNKRKELQMT